MASFCENTGTLLIIAIAFYFFNIFSGLAISSFEGDIQMGCSDYVPITLNYNLTELEEHDARYISKINCTYILSCDKNNQTSVWISCFFYGLFCLVSFSIIVNMIGMAILAIVFCACSCNDWKGLGHFNLNNLRNCFLE